MDEKTLKWAITLLQAAANNKTYGSLCFKIEAGKFTSAKLETTEKPPH